MFPYIAVRILLAGDLLECTWNSNVRSDDTSGTPYSVQHTFGVYAFTCMDGRNANRLAGELWGNLLEAGPEFAPKPDSAEAEVLGVVLLEDGVLEVVELPREKERVEAL